MESATNRVVPTASTECCSLDSAPAVLALAGPTTKVMLASYGTEDRLGSDVAAERC
jgi:hypothetical protein